MIKFTLILVLFAEFCFAQQSDLDFLIQKIKVDYPGYTEKTKHIDFDHFVAQTIAQNPKDTFKIMGKIVDFFHDRHLDLFREKEAINKAVCDKKLSEVRRYLSKQKRNLEGYWLSERNHCVIALVQTKRAPIHYKAYVIECLDSNLIYPGTEFYDFEFKTKNLFFTKAISTYSGATFYVNSIFKTNTVFTVGPYNKWKKIDSYKKPLLATLPQRASLTSGRWLDSISFLISIPSSTIENGEILDSLIKATPELSNQVQNLIIDLRGNTGGTTRAFTALYPLLYTKPILEPKVSLYCTQDDADNTKAEIEEYVKKGNVDSLYLKDWVAGVKTEEDNIGKFVDMGQDTIVFKKALAYPKNIGFIIDFSCQSAAEILLLNARQSKKTLFFGEHTMGAVDYLAFYPKDLPSKKYQLYIATSRREIPPNGSKLDGIGIYPDIHIADAEKNWVDFVKRYYEKN